MQLLGVRIDNLSRQEIVQKIENFLDGEDFHQVATINPEFLLEAEKNSKFKSILDSCELNVADGVGISYAFLFFGERLKARIAGADLLHLILGKAETKKLPVFLAVRKDGLSSYAEIKAALLKKYPALQLGGQEFANFEPYRIRDTGYKILFSNFGAPWQEIFLNVNKNANIKLAMGVGGSFDFETGKIRRAPIFWRKLGLEWLWRLIQEPRYRVRRIWKAVFVFPWKILCNKKRKTS